MLTAEGVNVHLITCIRKLEISSLIVYVLVCEFLAEVSHKNPKLKYSPKFLTLTIMLTLNLTLCLTRMTYFRNNG